MPASFVQLSDESDDRPTDFTVLQMIDGSLISVAVDEVDDNKADAEMEALAQMPLDYLVHKLHKSK